MKRILIFLLLLVNLQLTTDNGSLSIEFGEVSAQRVMESQLGKTVTRGGNGVDMCRWYGNGCRMEFNNDYSREIHEWGCPYRSVDCPSCGKQYIPAYGHFCEQNCPFCNMTLNMCVCDDTVITGRWTWYSSDPDYIPDYLNNRDDDGNWGGDGNDGASQSEPESRIHKHMSLKELRHKGGVKLLGNRTSTKASKKLYEMEVLHPQHIRGECVARAFAFIAELNGGDYNKVFNKLYNKILDVGGISHWDDHGSTTLFNEYINIVEYKNDFETVANLINNGIPVACSANDFPFHMEVIIGYDDKYYYVAAGNRDGDVSVLSRMSVNCNYVYGIK